MGTLVIEQLNFPWRKNMKKFMKPLKTLGLSLFCMLMMGSYAPSGCNQDDFGASENELLDIQLQPIVESEDKPFLGSLSVDSNKHILDRDFNDLPQNRNYETLYETMGMYDQSHVTGFDFEESGTYSPWNRTIGYLYRSDSSQCNYMFATLHLEDGQTLDGIYCTYYDNDASHYLGLQIYKKTQSSTSLCASYTSSNSASVQSSYFTNASGCSDDPVYIRANSSHVSFLLRLYTNATTSAVRFYQCSTYIGY
jgi:hypothetical protein